MTEYTHGAHAVYALEYHIVLVVKYRKPCLTGEIAEQCKRECIRILEHYEGKVLQIETDKDHIHIVVSLGTKYSIKEIVNVLKGVSARMLRRDHGDEIRQYLWNDSFWSDSYFIATSGGVTLDVLKKYVEEQGRPKKHYKKRKKPADSSPAK